MSLNFMIYGPYAGKFLPPNPYLIVPTFYMLLKQHLKTVANLDNNVLMTKEPYMFNFNGLSMEKYFLYKKHYE